MTRIQIRRGTAAQWAGVDPTLYEGELAYEIDTFKVKIGNGLTAWNDLPYVSLDWATLTGKPDYLAAGATEADACDAIGAEQTSAKGQPDGYASLDGGGKVPVSQLPSSLMAYLGVWNASTNSPSLVDGTGDTGDVYRVGTAGSRNLGGGSISFDVGDYVIYNGTRWEKSDTTDAVSSVNGLTGIVSITKSDLSLGNVDNTSDSTKNSATATLTNKTISGADNTLTGIELNSLATTGIVSDSTYLRGDGAWSKIANAALVSSAISIAGTSISLGDSISQDTITGLSTTGLIKRTGANTLATATSGTDYAPATSGSAILKGNGSGGFAAASSGTDYEGVIIAGTTSQYWRGDKSWQALDKTAVGLSNVDNTSDATKNSATATLTNKTISGANNTLSNIPQSAVTNLGTDLAGKISTSAVGAVNGVASLDSGGKVPVSQLPNSIMEYQGLWSAAANSPTLVDGTGDPGDVYRVSVAGSRNLGSGAIDFQVGDYVIYSPATSAWEKADTTDAVSSVNSYTGNVTLTKSDIGLGNVDNTSDATKNSASATLTNKTISGSSNTLTNIALSSLAATGTRDNTTYLRGDGSWATVSSGGISTGKAIAMAMVFG